MGSCVSGLVVSVLVIRGCISVRAREGVCVRGCIYVCVSEGVHYSVNIT